VTHQPAAEGPPHIEARILGQLLLMQSMLPGLTDEKAILAFVCRGLVDVPGIGDVSVADTEIQPRFSEVRTFPLTVGQAAHGALVVRVSDSDVFASYEPYLRNFCFMVAVVLEERRQRKLNEEHQQLLEERVSERTRQLRDEIETRHAAEMALAQNLQLLRNIIDSSLDLVFVKDLDLRTILCNEAFARALGKRPPDLIGKTDVENGWDPRFVYGDEEAGIKGYMADDRKILQGEVVSGSDDPAYVNGELRLFDTIKLPLRDHDGKIIGLLGISRDVTEKRRLEEEKLQFERQMQQSQKLESLGVMAGGIAHDFNNLLTSILGYSDMALSHLSPDSPVRELIEEVVTGARRAAELTNQLLAYSGKGHITVEAIDLSGLIQKMVKLLEISVSKKCVLACRLAKNLSMIEADATQIRQVVMNLIINGSEAIGEKEGEIMISTGVRECDADFLAESYLDDALPEGTYVFFEVADNGSGMTLETRARIFDPFFTTKFTGRGLGLAAVLGIVRRHRGAIKIHSEPGHGTSFLVLFPAANRPIRLVTDEKKATQAWAVEGCALVVDDEESVRLLARRMLEKMGLSVMTAADGEKGISLVRQHPRTFRLVLLDLTMPGLDGMETFQEIQRLEPGLPIIISSGFNQGWATRRFADCPPAGFIQKPYQFQELQSHIRLVLEAEGELRHRQKS
jgi:two-component system, cell cycle sensor histidine kinase and response regulator CckA